MKHVKIIINLISAAIIMFIPNIIRNSLLDGKELGYGYACTYLGKLVCYILVVMLINSSLIKYLEEDKKSTT